MAVILKSSGGVIFPVEVTCSECKRLSDVTEISDFHKMRGGASGRDIEDNPMAYVTCPICGGKAYPEGKLHSPLYKMVEELEKGVHCSPGIKQVTGILLPKPFQVCCIGGCHRVYEVTTLDGVAEDPIAERYFISCPNHKCKAKIYIYDGDVKSMLAELFLGIH